ncbi:MAG TPA: DUF4388 domain-containing protein [Myxococcota bacterium]|nr:DUF4388 domain-containing protein [Myxococcota bacterium]
MNHPSLSNIRWLEQHDAASFTGRIEEWPLWDVMMWLHLSKRTATLRVAVGGHAGSLSFCDGQLARCDFNEDSGVLALDKIMAL